MSTTADRVTVLLFRHEAGDAAAFDELFQLVYDDLRGLARRQLRARGGGPATLNTTALVHEAYLRLADSPGRQVRDRAHFFALASTAMRHMLIDYARGKNAEKRGGEFVRVTLHDGSASRSEQMAEILALNEALERLGDRHARLEKVVECRFFGGMTSEETASALGVSQRTVERDWRRARTYLYELLKPVS